MVVSVHQPAISVVMAVRDGERFLDESILSIRQQTFRDFELIIIDDGSKDTTPMILSTHAAQDARIRIFSQESKGLIDALHLGFSKALGKYIARMDADDVARPERLERQIGFLTSNPRVVVVGSSVQTVDALSQGLRVIRPPSDPDTVRRQMRENGCVVFHPTVLIRRDVLEQAKGFRKAYRHAEDYDLWLRILEQFDIANIDEVLLLYRRHESSVSYKHSLQQALSAFCARHMARLRLQGGVDFTSEVELITVDVLRALGVEQSSIDEAIFMHMIAVTEDVINSGVASVAAEFPRHARPYASEARLRAATVKLNRKAVESTSSIVEQEKHRRRLLASAPDIYWELFGPGAP